MLLFGLLGACSSFQKTLKKDISVTFKDSFAGFVLWDPETSEYLLEYQADKHFTPASNTKLLTFYLANAILGDSIIGFHYQEKGDSIWLWGTGDPSMLHPDFPDSAVLAFLRNKHITLVMDAFPEPKYGSGWAWDDYQGNYQREKSSFPIYGNALRLQWDTLNNQLNATPAYFKSHIVVPDTLTNQRRDLERNLFYYPAIESGTINIPFRTNWDLTARLLAKATSSTVQVVKPFTIPAVTKPFYSVPLDSLLKPLLQESDNFIAEQLILLCSNKLFGYGDSEKTIETLTDSLLADLPSRPIWVDGSGLSRYNMMTPRSLVTLLAKTKKEINQVRLFQLLPAGGESGTIDNLYVADTPYIFAKTGTLRHNHALSGYLVTKSGKVLIFSFMHNHFINGNAPIKKQMERILWEIHLNY